MDRGLTMTEYDKQNLDSEEEAFQYYILGSRAIRVTIKYDIPFRIEYVDKDGEFVRDNNLIRRLNDSLDVSKVEEHEFREYCLSQGIKI